MVTLKLEPSQATLDQVRELLHLEAHELDVTFGLVSVSATDGLYAILVDEDVARRIEGYAEVIGSFADPTIGPLPSDE
jgi:hypothetical protein